MNESIQLDKNTSFDFEIFQFPLKTQAEKRRPNKPNQNTITLFNDRIRKIESKETKQR